MNKITFYSIKSILEHILQDELSFSERRIKDKIKDMKDETSRNSIMLTELSLTTDNVIKNISNNKEIKYIIKDIEFKFVCYGGLIDNIPKDSIVCCSSKFSLTFENEGCITKVCRNKDFQIFINLVCLVEN